MKETSAGQRQLPPEGLLAARNYAIIDLGTQVDKKFGKKQPKVIFIWELPTATQVFKPENGPEPMVISHTYSISAGSEAYLPKILKQWGKFKELTVINPELLKKFLGKRCMINIEHNVGTGKNAGKTYANVGMKGLAVNPYMAEMKKYEPVNKDLFFDIDNFSWEVFDKIPEWIQKIIRECEEWPKVISRHPEPARQGAPIQSNGAPMTEASVAVNTEGPGFDDEF